jgi:hypothetical protein
MSDVETRNAVDDEKQVGGTGGRAARGTKSFSTEAKILNPEGERVC